MGTISRIAARGAEARFVGLAFVVVVMAPWAIGALALLSGSETAKGLLFSIHSALFFLLACAANVGAFALALASVLASRGSQRWVALLSVAAGAAVVALAAYPMAVFLHAQLNPPYKDSVGSYYALLFIPFSWLLRLG